MVKIVLTANLQKYYPEREFQLDVKSVQEVLAKMEARRAQFTSYILEDDRTIRKHVNVFLNGQLLPKTALGTALKSGDTVHIMQALSGG